MQEKILFVCTGNTCRSPMAMAIYNALTGTGNAQSAGLSVYFESPAAENAKNAVKKYGGNLDNHLSRQITIDDIQNYSLIITMTKAHKDMLRALVNSEKIITLSEFAGKKGDVSDPYGGDAALYEMTAEMIYDYIKSALSRYTFAADEDAFSIAELEKECFTDVWSESLIKTYIEKEQVVVYKENKNFLGYCIFMTAADEGEILRIAVMPKTRKKGIGSKLLDSVFSIMKKRGIAEVFLEVRASNKAAISLYEKYGFIKTGTRKNYYENKEDAILYNFKIKDR